jgi:hypothetical protein
LQNPIQARVGPVAGHRTKWEEDNRSPVNPWAILTVVALVLAVVGLALLFALL